MDKEDIKESGEKEQSDEIEPEVKDAPPEASEEDQVVTIGDEKEERSETDWLKDLRKSWKNYKKENDQLKRELKKIRNETAPRKGAIAPEPKPTIESCDYDTDVYDKKLNAWYESKTAYENEVKAKNAEAEKQNNAWNERLKKYNERKSSLPVKDYEDAELIVEDILTPTQQGIIVQGAKAPELVIYALGKNPRRAKDLASITHPVSFAFAIAELEGNLKLSKRRVTTKPEKTVKSTAPLSGATDSTLEKMRQEAEKTGDYSKVIAYKRKASKAA